MRKKMLVMIISFFIFMTTFNSYSLNGSGNLIEEERKVDIFHTLKITCNAKVTLDKGDKQSIKIKTDDNLMSLLTTEVKRGELTIAFSKLLINPTVLEINIVMENINELNLIGAGSIKVLGKLQSDDIKLKLNGSGNILIDVNGKYVFTKIAGADGSVDISGEVLKHDIEISGNGKVNALNLKTENTYVSTFGSGTSLINVSKILELKLGGGGNVKFKGKPKLKISVSTSGYVESLDE